MSAKRIAPGLYKTAEGVWIERIDADHECADSADFLPCWRAEDGRDHLGDFDTKREALASLG